MASKTQELYFDGLIAEFIQAQGASPDSYWRALFWVVAFDPHMAKRGIRIDLRRATAEATPTLGAMSHGEQLLLRLALHLFNDENPSPAISDLVFVLGGTWFQCAVEAMAILKTGKAPRTVVMA